MLVLDTSALLFWTVDPVKLSTSAREAIDTADHLIVSSISVWEIVLKVKRSRLEIGLPIEAYVAGLGALDRLRIEAVSVETWLKSVMLEWEHRDPADRVIVATAILHNCPLVSSDQTINDFYATTIW